MLKSIGVKQCRQILDVESHVTVDSDSNNPNNFTTIQRLICDVPSRSRSNILYVNLFSGAFYIKVPSFSYKLSQTLLIPPPSHLSALKLKRSFASDQLQLFLTITNELFCSNTAAVIMKWLVCFILINLSFDAAVCCSLRWVSGCYVNVGICSIQTSSCCSLTYKFFNTVTTNWVYV